MRLRPPSVPLITVDPYFSVWSAADRPTDTDTVHWTGFDMPVLGVAEIDGVAYRFLGRAHDGQPAMEMTERNVTAFSTVYRMRAGGVTLTLTFTSPLLPDDLYLLSRPVSYLRVAQENTDGKRHTVRVSLSVSEQMCLDLPGDDAVVTEVWERGSAAGVRMGAAHQKPLAASGDCCRIGWGYFYLATNAKGAETGA